MANQNQGVVTCTVKAGGSAIPDTYQIYAIQVEQSINRISGATISLLDGNPALENFSISASSVFVPGTEISIEAGYDGTNKQIFSGIVTKQVIRIASLQGPMLEVECKDKAIKMTVGRKSSACSKVKDSDAITKLINNSGGLSSSVTATTNEIPELVQYYVTDWDFMLARAEVNGLLVSTINNKVSVFDPTSDTSSVLTLTYGDNLYELNAELNSITQLKQVKASAWAYSSQALINTEASNNLPGPGNLSSAKLADVVGLSSYELQTSAAESSDELTTWAKAQMLKSELAKIVGDARFQGTSEVLPGKYVTLAGAGCRFDGDHFVSSVRHDISDGNWVSEINLGLSPRWFVQENEVEAPDAAGLLPGIQGLFNATVKKIDSDPDNEYRILVEVALFNDNDTGLWVRLSNFYSTNGQGAFFLPEVGDEVILGFLNQDPRYPVILGSLYSQKNKPYSEFTPNEKNSLKGIVTKSELRIMFDDEQKTLTLITPDKNTLMLDDKNKQIEVKDENGNSMTMSSSGIAIKSSKNISIEADQKVTIKGNSGIDIQSSTGDVTTTGNNISETANMQYAAKGNMTAAVQGGTELTLKGLMVMIN